MNKKFRCCTVKPWGNFFWQGVTPAKQLRTILTFGDVRRHIAQIGNVKSEGLSLLESNNVSSVKYEYAKTPQLNLIPKSRQLRDSRFFCQRPRFTFSVAFPAPSAHGISSPVPPCLWPGAVGRGWLSTLPLSNKERKYCFPH